MSLRRPTRTVLFTVVLCGASALIVTTAHSLWHEKYLVQLAYEKNATVLELLGLAEIDNLPADDAQGLFDEFVRTEVREGVTVYTAEIDGHLVGYAFDVIGRGRHGPIRGIMAVKADRRTILGLRIYDQHETPGYGANVAGERWLGRFVGKVILAPGFAEPGMIIGGSGDLPNRVDAITGATYTSRAAAEMLNAAIRAFYSDVTLVPLQVAYPEPAFLGVTGLPQNTTALPPPKTLRPSMLVPEGTVNLAAGRAVTSNDEFPVVGEVRMITDGDKAGAAGRYVELGDPIERKAVWVQVDLGGVCEIEAILLWHFHGEPRIFRDVIVQLADDAAFTKNVRTLYNNDGDNSAGLGAGADREYVETFQGLQVEAGSARARVVRVYTNGSVYLSGTEDPMSQFTELEVHGGPVN